MMRRIRHRCSRLVGGRWSSLLRVRKITRREARAAGDPGARQLRGRRNGHHRPRHVRPDQAGRVQPRRTDPAGQTLHGDHAYVFYQVPANARKLPLVFWHGHGQSAKTWETTPDGREGFQNIFLRRRFPVYLSISRGAAARRAARSRSPLRPRPTSSSGSASSASASGRTSSRACSSRATRRRSNQFFRQMVPNTGPYDVEVNTEAVSALFEQDRPGHPCHAFAERRAGLAHGDQEQECPRHRLLRAGRRLSFSRREKCRRP